MLGPTGMLLLAATALPAGSSDCGAPQPGVPGPNARFAAWIDADYTGPSVEGHCGQRCNVFVPQATMPEAGWPVLVVLDLDGFRASRRYEWLDPDDPTQSRNALAYQALTDPLMPMVVVFATCTVSRGGASDNAVASSDYDPWAADPVYGPAYLGNGVFIPPGVVPAGYAGSLPPFTDPARPMAEKDAVMLIQHVKQHAASFPPGVTGAVKLDTTRMVAHGISAGAMALMWPVLGPERAAGTFPTPVPGSQEEQGTRVPLAVLEGGAMYFPRVIQQGLPRGTGVHFPALQGADGTWYDVPGKDLIDNGSYQEAASALVYGLDGQSSDLAALNSRQALYLTYLEHSSQPGPLCFVEDPITGNPADCWWTEDVEANLHSSWHGHAWKVRYDNTILVTTAGAAYDEQGALLSSSSGVPAVPDWVLPDNVKPAELASHQMDWIRSQLLGPEGSWTDLGEASAGVHGSPHMDGYCTARPNAPLALQIGGALESTPVALVIGYARIDVPVGGGLFVPQPDIILFDVPHTDSLGRLVVSSSWPPVMPSGFEVYLQTWIFDPAGWGGLSSTNALRLVAP